MLRACLITLLFARLIAPFSAYADERLPIYLIRLPDSVSSVFVAETSTARFHRFDRIGDAVRNVGKRYMSIGQQGVGKERVGDKRTPLGVYFVTEKLDTTRLHEKYGASAYPLDYPNAWDLRLGRSGSGIWVHGMDPRADPRPRRDTDGCIALSNDDLAALADQFRDNRTPVLITREIEWSDAEARLTLRQELDDAIGLWASSLESGDMFVYLSLYADNFEHWGMRKPQWSAFSLQSVGQREIQKVVIEDLLLLGYPSVDGLYLSRFRHTVSEDTKVSTSIRRLYWRRDENGALKIVAQDSG